MSSMRRWSVKHAKGLIRVYDVLEDAALNHMPESWLDGPLFPVEKKLKSALVESQSCGQCILSYTGMSCPMNCPKKLRNGPCGGVRADGTCELDPEMDCVWVRAWEGNKTLDASEPPIQVIQPPVDHRLLGTSAWSHEQRRRRAEQAQQAQQGSHAGHLAPTSADTA
ncbi:MAG: methylenetetrahydrofolate reductase C-terminal domain-containing protein [Pseudomonadota bacterium]